MTEAAAPVVPPLRVVLMGVSGCGKSTVGEGLSARLGWHFVEGDSLHPPENVAKMSAGQPLGDQDRAGWLDALSVELASARSTEQGLVVSCSALKRSYRDRLRAGDPHVLFVHLAGSRECIAQRLAARTHLYMPPTLLASQFADLQPPEADEQALCLDVEQTPAQLMAAIVQHLQTQTCSTP